MPLFCLQGKNGNTNVRFSLYHGERTAEERDTLVLIFSQTHQSRQCFSTRFLQVERRMIISRMISKIDGSFRSFVDKPSTFFPLPSTDYDRTTRAEIIGVNKNSTRQIGRSKLRETKGGGGEMETSTSSGELPC